MMEYAAHSLAFFDGWSRYGIYFFAGGCKKDYIWEEDLSMGRGLHPEAREDEQVGFRVEFHGLKELIVLP